MDGSLVLLGATARTWLLIGLGGLALSVGSSPARVAVVLGALLLGFQALTTLSAGLWHLVGAGVAWEEVRQLFDAAARGEGAGGPAAPPAAHQAGELLLAEGLVYRYPGREAVVLQDCSLRVKRGDRVLLEGPSGSGKSTLIAVLAGFRMPESGLLRLAGIERRHLDRERWRQRVVAAPQFHENHVILGPLAFNLLLGKRWPPRPEDLVEAEAVTRALGLGELLDRLPSGLQQMVGETGWRLSHGEQSLVFAARALLQHPDLMLLDESLGAVDQVRVRQSLAYLVEKAPALIVIVQ
jgi:ATP-binding cassette subfamily B protein